VIDDRQSASKEPYRPVPNRHETGKSRTSGWLDGEFFIPLDDGMMRVAMLVVLGGALTMQLWDWTTVGWILIAFGMAALWLSHQIAIAPLGYEADELPSPCRRQQGRRDRSQPED